MSELHDMRLDRLEAGFQEVRATLTRLEPLIIRIDERLNSTLPHLATKAELQELRAEMLEKLAEKPGKLWLTAAIGILIATYALGLGGLAALPVVAGLIH